MEKEILTKEELLIEIHKIVSQLNGLTFDLQENDINRVPFEGSWTAGQLVRHVTKSLSGIAASITAKNEEVDRDPTEKIAGLKKTFLDYSTKMKSPGFIVPEDMVYDKLESIDQLNIVFENLKTNAEKENLNEAYKDFPGDILSKLELLHFALFHSQRHLHQLHKIVNALHEKE